jgi:hypothetical protein
VIKKLALQPLFLEHLRDGLSIKNVLRVVMDERLSNLRPIIFARFANGAPQTEVRRGLQGALMRQADCGKIVIAVSEDIDPDHRRGDVVAGLSLQPDAGCPRRALSVQRTRAQIGAPRDGLDAADRRDLEISYGTLGVAGQGVHGASPGAVEGTRSADAEHPLALDRLFPRGLDRDLGQVCSKRRGWGLAKNGENTWARRRGGLTPETPPRKVETTSQPPA